MKYIVTKRFKTTAICGEVNLPFGTECHSQGNVIYSQNLQPLCVITSENAHVYFTANDDGLGLMRRELIDEISKLLSNPVRQTERCDKIWNDSLVCPRYKQPGFTDCWFWNQLFYEAPIDDLQYIKNLLALSN